MSTRAIYTFTDDDQTVSVYKHDDGYPTGAAEAIEKAKSFAWGLPRFEPDEFAAAFVAANKFDMGGVRIIPQNVDPKEFAGDAEYHYYITQTHKNRVLMVHAFKTNYWIDGSKSPWEQRIISCSQEAFGRHAIDWTERPEDYRLKYATKPKFEPILGVDF